MIFPIVLFLSLNIINAYSKVMPDFLPQPCSISVPNYNECTLKFFNKLKPFAMKGIREINLPPFSPFYVSAYSTNSSVSGLGFIDGTIKNIAVFGLENGVVDDFKLDFKTLTGEAVASTPSMQGSLEYDGALKLSPTFVIRRDGYFKGNGTNLSMRLTFKLKIIERLGVKYLTFDRFSVRSRVGDGQIKAIAKNENEQGIADFITNIINNSPIAIMSLFQEPIDEMVGTIARRTIEKALHTIPLTEAFPQ